jgi:hypothetical protein
LRLPLPLIEEVIAWILKAKSVIAGLMRLASHTNRRQSTRLKPWAKRITSPGELFC